MRNKRYPACKYCGEPVITREETDFHLSCHTSNPVSDEEIREVANKLKELGKRPVDGMIDVPNFLVSEKESWEEGFDRRFVKDLSGENVEDQYWNVIENDYSIKSFIRQLLAKERERVAKEIMEMPIELLKSIKK